MSITQPLRSKADEYCGPPRSWFLEQQWFERDIEAIFRSRWLVAGHVDQLEANGKHGFLTFGVGDNEVFIRRDEDGEVRAFHNVCPHRGARLCNAGSGSAPSKRIVCPYHQWTFSVDDGHLINSRQMHADFDQSGYSLKPAQVDVWNGVIFVCFSEDLVPSVSDYLADGSTEGFDFGRTKLAAMSSHEIDANWKVVVDNNSECYHCAVAHPELCEFLDWRFLGDGVFNEDFAAERAAGREIFTYLLPASGRTLSGDPICDIPLARYEGATPELGGSWQIGWEPGVVLLFSPESAWMFVPLPLDSGRTELRQYWFVHEDAVEGRNYDVEALKAFSMTVMLQDKDLCEMVQRGLGNRAYEPGPLNRIHQQANAGFFRWYEGQMLRKFPDAGR